MRYFRTALICTLAAVVSSCSSPKQQADYKPLIGISTGYSDSQMMSVQHTYVWSVENAGGIPVILPLIRDSIMCETILSRLDGVILTGGGDVDPIRYGHDTKEECGIPSPERDASDLMLARCAVRNDIPLLGICRGEQVTNVALGGTLIQDIPTEVASNEKHNQDEARDIATQTIGIVPGTALSSILGGIDSLAVNTFHHQAVLDLAPGLKVNALAKDGIIEGYEGFPEMDVLAVQFHPEGFAQHGTEPYLSVFKDFVKRTAAKHHSAR